MEDKNHLRELKTVFELLKYLVWHLLRGNLSLRDNVRVRAPSLVRELIVPSVECRIFPAEGVIPRSIAIWGSFSK